jgi:hypothetical protein
MNQTEPTKTGVPARRYHSRRIRCASCVCICSRAARFRRSTRRKTSNRRCSTSGKRHFSRSMRFRDPVADFLRHHAALTGPPVALLLRWLANCPRKFHRWQDPYGKVNRHNAKILCDHWIELHEGYTSAPPSLTSPGVIHWKATTACAELGPIRASSVEGRRIREKVLTNGSSLPFFDPLSINRI